MGKGNMTFLIQRNHSTDNFLQEQFQNKTRFNFVKFDAEAIAWKDKLAEVNEENIEDAILWIKQLQVTIEKKLCKWKGAKLFLEFSFPSSMLCVNIFVLQ